MNEQATATSAATSKRQAQLEALIAKEEKARAERLANLKARLEKEQSKTKELAVGMEGLGAVMDQLDSLTTLHSVSMLKLLDFLAKQKVGETARVVYRRKREPKAPKQPKAPRKVAAKKVVKK